MKASDWGEGVITMRTSIEIPEELWTAAKVRAVHDKTNLQDVIAAALREYLKKTKRGGREK
jgi:metal-responsive CopG/Arc/MetJ family transcriptional regulator